MRPVKWDELALLVGQELLFAEYLGLYICAWLIIGKWMSGLGNDLDVGYIPL